MIRCAEIAQANTRLGAEAPFQLCRDARFANAWFPQDQHDLTVARFSAGRTAQQQVDLLVAADQRAQRRSTQCLEPARDRARSQYLPSGHRRGETLDLDCTEIPILEQSADQPARARGDHHSARLGQGLQTSGEIRCIADDIVLDNLAADDDQPGGNPDSCVELFLMQPRHPLDQRQPASRGTLGVVLVCLRISEIKQDAVAHIAGDKSAKGLDNLCDAAMVGAHDPAQFFGIKPGG